MDVVLIGVLKEGNLVDRLERKGERSRRLKLDDTGLGYLVCIEAGQRAQQRLIPWLNGNRVSAAVHSVSNLVRKGSHLL